MSSEILVEPIIIGGLKTAGSSPSDLGSEPLDLSDPLSSESGQKADDLENHDASELSEKDSLFSSHSSPFGSLKLDDDETRDLTVIVDNPEKHASTIDSYVTFRITTKTTRGEYDNHEYCVRRRYNDFVWLRQRLEELHPTHLIPPLPEKHSLQRVSRFNDEFLKTRMRALNQFLTRVADHQVLSFDKNYQTFLTAKPWEFSSYKKQGISFISRVGDSLHSMAAAYMIKNRNPEFNSMNDYNNTLGEKLCCIERIAQRIQSEQQNYLIELSEFHPIFTLWSSSETKLSTALLAMASAVEKCAKAQEQLSSSYETRFAQPLREYALYTEAIKAVLKRRDAIQMGFEVSEDELEKRRNEKDQLKSATPTTISSTATSRAIHSITSCGPSLPVKLANQTYSLGAILGKDPEDVKQEKEQKLEKQISDLIRQVEVNEDHVDRANADLKADMDLWHKQKQQDIKNLFITLADREINCLQKCLEAWDESIPNIRDTDLNIDSNVE